jgi:hypothetical protein
MSTTSELVERLRTYCKGDHLLEAADRLEELERENARLREALAETHLDLAVYTDIEIARKRLVERRAALTPEPGSET